MPAITEPQTEKTSNVRILMNLPVQVQLASPAIHEWITRRKENIRPWMIFLSTQKFKSPQNFQRWTKRIVQNVDYFQSNYVFIFLGLIIYCLITSPLLFLAMFASLGACYILSLRNVEQKITIAGHEVSLAHQFLGVSLLSLPVFYIAGAGAVLFWVLGASFFVIALHATFYNIDAVVGSDEEPFEEFESPIQEV